MASFLSFCIVLYLLSLFFGFILQITPFLLIFIYIRLIIFSKFRKKIENSLGKEIPKQIKIISISKNKGKCTPYKYYFRGGYWSHSKKDGTPDLRYKSNFYVKEKYFLEFDLEKYQYKVKSKDDNAIQFLITLLNNK